MTGFSDATEQAALDGLFSATAFAGYTNLFVALFSVAPDDTGGGTEASGGGYARVSTASADWNAATGTAPAIKDNSSVITFPTATGDWSGGANMVAFALFSASTGGDFVAWGPLTNPKPVLSGDTARYTAGELRIRLGDPGDFP